MREVDRPDSETALLARLPLASQILDSPPNLLERDCIHTHTHISCANMVALEHASSCVYECVCVCVCLIRCVIRCVIAHPSTEARR